MTDMDLGELMREGCIVDNRRIFEGTRVTLKEVLKQMAKHSEGLKTAVGYFYIEGLSEIIFELQELKDIRILMGGKQHQKPRMNS